MNIKPQIEDFKRQTSNLKTIEELVGFTFKWGNKEFNIWPVQIPLEILALCERLEEFKPKNILEIGTFNGGTLFLFCHVASPQLIISVDDPYGFNGVQPSGYPLWKIPFYKTFVRSNQDLHLIRDDSHRQETLHRVKQILRGRLLDFVFLDGDHSYEGVKRDFEMYSPLIRKGGLVAVHDIVRQEFQGYCQVDRFWDEVKFSFHMEEIVASTKKDWAGIGLLWV